MPSTWELKSLRKCPNEALRSALEKAGKRTGRQRLVERILPRVMPEGEGIRCEKTRAIAEHHANGRHARVVTEAERFLAIIFHEEKGKHGVALVDYDRLLSITDPATLMACTAVLAMLKIAYREAGNHIAAAHMKAYITELLAMVEISEVLHRGTA